MITLLATISSWVLAFATQTVARRTNVVDMPGGRKTHARPTPLLGGVGIGAVIIAGILLGIRYGWFAGSAIETRQLLGFCAGIAILMIGGALDDRYNLRPWQQVTFPFVATLCVLASGTSIDVVSPLVESSARVWSLQWFQLGGFVFPAHVVAFVWMMAVTYATKLMDGVDGLVAGQTVVGCLLIALLALTPAYAQPAVVALAMLCLGAFLGFLPHNIFPAKQFLGEAGSTIAGFTLAFLAIVSGAKVATTFMAVGIPLLDIALVMFIRWRERRPLFSGDRVHIHHRLLRVGFTSGQTVVVIWSVSLLFGALALGLQTRGKTLLMLVLAACVAASLAIARARKVLSRKAASAVLVTLVLAAVAAMGWFVVGSYQSHAQVTLRKVDIAGLSEPLRVELALTALERQKGLSGRDSQGPREGMLFVFPYADRYAFWMPEMRFDLDIIWLRNGVVVDVQRLPAPKEGEEPASYTPRIEANMVLELPAGRAQEYGLQIGSKVDALQDFQNLAY